MYIDGCRITGVLGSCSASPLNFWESCTPNPNSTLIPTSQNPTLSLSTLGAQRRCDDCRSNGVEGVRRLEEASALWGCVAQAAKMDCLMKSVLCKLC